MATLPTDYNELKAMATAHGYEWESQKKADLVVFLESINASLPEDETNGDLWEDNKDLGEDTPEDETNTNPVVLDGKTAKITLKETVLGLWKKWETVEVAESELKNIPEVWYK